MSEVPCINYPYCGEDIIPPPTLPPQQPIHWYQNPWYWLIIGVGILVLLILSSLISSLANMGSKSH